MRICYVDEAGCTGMLPTPRSLIQPVIVLAGVTFERLDLYPLTLSFMELKARFYPGLMPRRPLGGILAEIKGAELRRDIRTGSRQTRRHTLGFVDRIFDLLEQYNAKIFGKILIKGIGQPIDGRAVYTSSIQSLCTYFQSYLESENDMGLMLADSRTKQLNANVSHSVFTQKFKAAGDDHSSLVEMPVFGHSENHAGLQISDILCSAILYPMATFTYCTGHVNENMHVHPSYEIIKNRYGLRVRQRQYRYQDGFERWRGGITVNECIAQRSSALLFR